MLTQVASRKHTTGRSLETSHHSSAIPNVSDKPLLLIFLVQRIERIATTVGHQLPSWNITRSVTQSRADTGPCGFQDPMDGLAGCTGNEKEWVAPCERPWEAQNQLASGCFWAASKQGSGRLQPLRITCHVLSSSPAAGIKNIHKIQGNPQHSSNPANQCLSLWFHLSFILLLWTWVLQPRAGGVHLHRSPGSHLCSTRLSGLRRDTCFDTPIYSLSYRPWQVTSTTQSLKFTLNMGTVLLAQTGGAVLEVNPCMKYFLIQIHATATGNVDCAAVSVGGGDRDSPSSSTGGTWQAGSGRTPLQYKHLT